MLPTCKPRASWEVLVFCVCFHSYSFALLTNTSDISVTFHVPFSGLSLKLLVLVYVSHNLMFHLPEIVALFLFFFFNKQMRLHKFFPSGHPSHSCCIIYSLILKMLKNLSGRNEGHFPHFNSNTGVCQSLWEQEFLKSPGYTHTL